MRDRLYAHIDGIPALDRTPDQDAIGLAAAAIEYHRREDKSYWWEHFARHILDLDDWEDTRDVIRNWSLEREFTPQMDQETSNRLYARWKDAVQRSLDWERAD